MKAAILTAQYLRLNGHALAGKQVVLGFDGFVDSIQKVILRQSAEGKAEYFGADTTQALTLANTVAAFYLKNGFSPSFGELTAALENKGD